PDFLAVDDKVVAVLDGASLKRGKIGAGAGLRIALAPDFVAGENLRQVALFLLVGPPMHQGGSEQTEPHPKEWHRCTGALQLLRVDDVLQDTGSAAAVFLGPTDSYPPAGVKLLVPGDTPLPIAFVLLRGHPELGTVLGFGCVGVEPRAKLGSKSFV